MGMPSRLAQPIAPCARRSVLKKIASQRGRAPQGMTRDDWKQAIADYDAARDAWTKAASEMTRKNFEETVLAARDAKAKISAIMEKVGVQAS